MYWHVRVSNQFQLQSSINHPYSTLRISYWRLAVIYLSTCMNRNCLQKLIHLMQLLVIRDFLDASTFFPAMSAVALY